MRIKRTKGSTPLTKDLGAVKPLPSQMSLQNPLTEFNIHQIKEFANIPNSTVRELNRSRANSDSMLHISVLVPVPGSRDVLRFVSRWAQSSLCHRGGGGARMRWPALQHLGLSRRAGCRAESSVGPKRLLTHIWCHEWHFTSLSCQPANPYLLVCFGPACIIYVGY